MILINNSASLEMAIASSIDPQLKAVLCLRRDQLSEYASDIGELAHFVIIQAGDRPEQIEPPPLVNLVDGCRFGDPGFTPSWEHIQDHDGWYELTYVLSDDGFGHALFVQNDEATDPELLSLCRVYTIPASQA